MADKCELIIKAEDSWHSDTPIEYSRAYHYKGAQVSTTLKKISRIHSEANQTVPKFNALISCQQVHQLQGKTKSHITPTL
jgi:hypothetical protein